VGGSSRSQNRTNITCELIPVNISCFYSLPAARLIVFSLGTIGSDFDVVEGWIQNGGPVSFQGLEDLAEVTVSKNLSAV
jgi:hypothetical protein